MSYNARAKDLPHKSYIKKMSF